MRQLAAMGAALAALGLAMSAAATVVPPTPEQIVMMNKREALENRARAAFGETGLIEKLRDWRSNWGFILVGDEGSRRAPRLLIKDAYGWYEMRAGETKRLPDALGLELNRLLHRQELWAEDAYNFHAKCVGKPLLFVIMHAGQDKFGRLGCGPEGLAARAARTAEAVRALPGEARTTAPPRQEPPHPPGAPPAYFEASNQVSGRLFEKVAAWDRKTLAGFVEPYAPDVVLEGPSRTYRGRKNVLDWARHLQDWDAPYSEADGRLRLERVVSQNQPAKDVFYTTHELRWEEAGKPVRQTFSTMWRNHGGLWLIAHEKMSEVKPVTDQRVPW
ncbi:MAG TPA: nuclear transport factor 2 family protein [Allosphingosinicella sp.]